MNNKFYITTAIPYVNAKPHIGFALELIQADAIARFHRINGENVTLLTGSDENALKNVQAAETAGKPVQQFVDENAKLFEDLAKKLNIKFDIFQKGSSQAHHKSSQELWKLCEHDIYKKTYTGLYCVGCEQFYEISELNENGECFEHPGKKLEEVSEENYFFKLSDYTEKIKNIISQNEVKIIPEKRKNEILSFLKDGLQDISISRSNERAKNWGVSVPGDDSQKMYVWFDALNIYRSGVEDKNVWPADLHVIGKGILRFHAVYWLAFLLSANLPLPKEIFVHEYLTIDGQKMSKTLGNVVDPVEIIEKYGTDALRYYLLAKVSPFQDGDYSEEKFKEAYNADLANGLGNLIARVAKLCENKKIIGTPYSKTDAGRENEHVFWLTEPDLEKRFIEALENYKLNEAIGLIWNEITKLDRKINENKPWEKEEDEGNFLKYDAVYSLRDISRLLKLFLPETAERIEKQFSGPEIKSAEPLFPRI